MVECTRLVRIRVGWLLLSAGLAAALVALSPAARGATPEVWKRDLGAASSAELFAAAEQVEPSLKAGQDVVVLFRSSTIRVDEEGRLRLVLRSVLEVLTEDGVDEIGRLSTAWDPWYQERPVLEARVVHRNGNDRLLDPATISEAAVDQEGELYSDRKAVEAPLPGLEPGVIVDQRVVIEHREPFFVAGETITIALDDWNPIAHREVVLEYPRDVAVRYEVTGGEPEAGGVEESETDGWRTVRLVRSGIAARSLAPYYQGLDPVDLPAFSVSTGESWGAVARHYADRVDEVIAAGASTLADSPQLPAEPAQAVAEALEWLHARVRYTGLELGEAGIIPHGLPAILERGYGDCKDQATMMVALLRRAGIDAHVALLRASLEEDVDPDLPGLGQFNHAIVHVRDGGGLWVDPTSRFSDRGGLPVLDQGRLALVASRSTTDLELTPVFDFSSNSVLETREVEMVSYGPGRVRETTVYRGELASALRPSWRDVTVDDAEDLLADYVQSSYAADQIGEIQIGDARRLDEPFELRLDVPEAGLFVTDLNEAVAILDPSVVLGNVPDALLMDPAEDEGEEELSSAVLRVGMPHRNELVYLIEPPPGMTLRDLPSGESIDFPGGSYRSEFSEGDQGRLEARFALEMRERVLDYEDYRAARESIFDLAARDLTILWFDHESTALLDAGRPVEALELLTELAREAPKDPVPYAKMVNLWLAAGLKEQALEAAKRAVEVAPDSAVAHWSLASVHEYGESGIRFAPGFDRGAAIESYRRAMELDPEEDAIRLSLAVLYEHGDDGVQYGPGAALDEAISLLEPIVGGSGDTAPFELNILIDQLRLGRYDDILNRELPDAAQQEVYGLVIAASAARDGAAAAARKARQLGLAGNERSTVIEQAASQLALMGSFRVASDLLGVAASGAANSSAILMRARVTAAAADIQEAGDDRSTPEAVVIRLILAMNERDLDKEAFLDQVHPLARPLLGDRFWAAVDAGRISTKAAYESLGLDLSSLGHVASVMVAAGSVLEREGSAELGFKIEAHSGTSQKSETYLLAMHEGVPKVVAGSGFAGPAALMAWEMLQAGEADAAATWLEWAKDLGAGSYYGRLFDALAERLPEQAPVTTLIFSLLAQSQNGEVALEREIEPAAELFEKPDDREALAWLRVLALMSAERTEDAVEALDAISRSDLTESDRAMVVALRSQTLVQADRFDEAERYLRERLAEKPGDLVLIAGMMDLFLQKGDAAGVIEWAGELLDQAPNNALALNNLAWAMLFEDDVERATVTPRVLELAERGANASNARSRASLHTLATVYAFAGEPLTAYAALSESIRLDPSLRANSHDWLVFARIAESFGLVELAERYYRRVIDGETGDESGLSSSELARRRLAALAG